MEGTKNDEFNSYIEEQEYIANKYVMKCFTIMMIVFTITFILNLLGVFVIEQSLMWKAFIPSVIIYFIVCVVTKVVPMSKKWMKYFILLGVTIVFTRIGMFITYHVVLVPLLSFLYAAVYSSKSVMRYVYFLTVVSTIVTVYGGYYYGLCDANMALLTSQRVQDYVSNGQFTLVEVNTNPNVTLMLFFVIPRCLTYIAYMAVCNSLFNIISGSVEKAKSAAQLERFQVELKKKVDEQTEEIRNQQIKTKKLFIETVTALSEAVDAKDRYTSGHSKRVAEYARMIAIRMGKSKEEQDEIYRAGLLHDIGKIRIPAEIINKPGKLTDEEYNIIKIHPVTGYHILRGISEDSAIAVGCKYHHERYDGKGYPNGLSGDKIPEVARILGVADAYDAMASNRSYRDALPQSVVKSEIEKGLGTQFDPAIAEIMLQMIDEDKEYALKQTDCMQRKVLVVDDDTSSSGILKLIMSDEPMYELVCVKSGKEALDILAKQSFDLVLLDVLMPEMDGLETLKHIKSKYNVPVVFMTGDRNIDISEYGCDDFITKPFLPLLVKEIVHNMTERTSINITTL